jgi:hypothetical protein
VGGGGLGKIYIKLFVKLTQLDSATDFRLQSMETLGVPD